MKKIVSILLSVVLFLPFVFTSPNVNADAEKSDKILVAYFSRNGENYSVGVVEKGNTELLAEIVANKTGGDMFKIETANAYPSNYKECTEIARKEHADNARPELKTTIDNFDAYDTFFIGYPIWYGDMPMAMYTFFESYDFSGKTIIPFNTHEGSGQAGTVSTIQSLCQDATVMNGFSVRGSVAQNNNADSTQIVTNWLNDNGYMLKMNYTIEDIVKLQNFLLARKTSDLKSKNYDLNNDGKWDVFDLCLMKQIVLNHSDKEEIERTTMKITLNNKEYDVKLDHNETVNDIISNMPMELNMVRYAGHEFYSALPFTPAFAQEQTSEIKAGHIYYWDGWNAFVINYADADITPYKVVHIGEITDKSICDVLENGTDKITIKVKEK